MLTPKRLAPVGALCCCLAALSLACLSGYGQERSNLETYAKTLLARVQLGNGFNYDVAGLVPITDSKSREPRQLCYLFGGAPTSTTGAVGVFDSAGSLLDAKPVKGLYDYETNASALAGGDSVVLRVLNASGTGLHDESFVVLTLYGGKLLETFRCSGLNYSMHGEFYDQKVQLVFRDLYGDGTHEIIRLVTTNHYASNVDQENEKASVTRRTAEVFEFDTKTRRYVRVFE